MSFCKFSSDYLMESFTLVDNLFMNEYLPYAEEGYIKVYLYGLYLCTNPSGRDNSVESFAKVLDMDEDKILEIFKYWQDQGLLEIISVNPLEVRYLSIKGAKQPPKSTLRENSPTSTWRRNDFLTPVRLCPTSICSTTT